MILDEIAVLGDYLETLGIATAHQIAMGAFGSAQEGLRTTGTGTRTGTRT